MNRKDGANAPGRTRLVMIEGIPGSGKTTSAHFVANWLGKDARLYEEGDLDHPADFESVACLDAQEYTALLGSYPSAAALLEQRVEQRRGDWFIGYRKLQNELDRQLLAGLPEGLIADLAKYEIYELPAERYCRLTAARWQDFAQAALQKPQTQIFECCFLQNPMTTLLARHNWPVRATGDFVLQLEKSILPLNPLLIYLDPADVRQTLQRAARSRPKEWLEFVIQYVTGQEWGKKNAQTGFDGMVAFYETRRNAEKEAFERLGIEKLWLENAGSDWAVTSRQIGEFLKKNVRMG
jgi:hypothetical protein